VLGQAIGEIGDIKFTQLNHYIIKTTWPSPFLALDLHINLARK
jgi:hypothetical protein